MNALGQQVYKSNHLILLFCSIFFAVSKVLMPLKEWLRWNDFRSQPLPTVPWEDSVYYLSQVRAVIQGENSFGNPIFFESHLSNQDFSYGNSFLFVMWGQIGRSFDLQVLQTYLVMVATNSVVFSLSCYFLARIFTSRSYSAMISILLVLFIQSLGRPSPTQQTLGLGLFAVFFYIQGANAIQTTTRSNIDKRFFVFMFIFICLILSNPLYAGFVVIFGLSYDLISHILLNKRAIWGVFTRYSLAGLLISLMYAIYMEVQTDHLDSLMALRFGVHESRLPGAIPLSVISILGIFFSILIIRRVFLSDNYRIPLGIPLFLLSANVALLLAINSQVITGKAYEMESHFRLLAYTLNLLGFTLLILMSFTNKKKAKLVLCSFVILLTAANILSIFSSQKILNSRESQLVKILNRVDGESRVVLVRNDDGFRLSELLIYTTDAKLYWHPYITLSRADDVEVIQRFACARKDKLTFEEFQQLESEIYFHRFANDELKLSRASSFFKFLMDDFSRFQEEKMKILKRDYESYLAEYEKCQLGVYPYQLDLIVDLDSKS